MKSSQILSQRIDNLTLDQLYKSLKGRILAKKKALAFAMNVHILVKLSQDTELKNRHNKADYIYADGLPLVWLSNFSQMKLSGRVSGTDLCYKILNDPHNKVFLLGSTQRILRKIKKKFGKSVIDYYSPSFKRVWEDSENIKIIQRINKSKATVLLVAVGPTKQEEWLLNYFNLTSSLIGLGVGSALDIISEEKPRAPLLLKDYGFEWLWRILLEPRRLARRYFADVLALTQLFISHLLKKLRLKLK